MTETQAAPTSMPPDREASAPERSRTYTWHDPMELADVVSGLGGLELFEKLGRGELPPPPIAQTLSFGRIEATGPGSITLYLEPQEFHFNPIGSMHGGVISAVLDTAAGCSVHTTLPAGLGYTSLDLHTRFLRAVTLASGTLRCDGRVMSKTRQTALAESHLYDANDRLVAHATSTCLIFPIPAR
jgi:uncharacterized protein (TIGR00369 family)